MELLLMEVHGTVDVQAIDEINDALARLRSEVRVVAGNVERSARMVELPEALHFAAAIAGVLNFALNVWKSARDRSGPSPREQSKELEDQLRAAKAVGYLPTSTTETRRGLAVTVADIPARMTVEIQIDGLELGRRVDIRVHRAADVNDTGQRTDGG
jgi:hypothetical protein